MKTVYLLPGIMGSRLALNGREIWPPTISELTVSHYSRMAELSNPSAVSTDLIRQVTDCYVVYGSLMDDLRSWGYEDNKTGGNRGRLIPWHYDWRKDIREIAASLSTEFRTASEGGKIDLVIIAHSMGGLIARYALEVDDPAMGDVAWRASCSGLITLGTPHRGAPLALVRALGLESAMGMRAADIKSFTANPQFPSAYQLLPPANAFSFWNAVSNRAPLEVIDIADPIVAEQLHLNSQNLHAATELYQALAKGKRPAKCRYFNFIGRKLDTIVRGTLDAASALTAPKVQDGGDGTVPIWSGTLPETQFQLDGDEHGRTFRDTALRQTLAQLLGVPAGQVRGIGTAEPLVLKLPKSVFQVGETARFRIDAAVPQGSEITLTIQRIEETGAAVGAPTTLSIMSSDTANDAVIFAVNLPSQPGIYTAQARLSGAREGSEPQSFAVQIKG
jgi:phospholipase A1